jgi:hypothetical protein
VEGGRPGQVARTDQVDLLAGTWPHHRSSSRVRRPLGHVATTGAALGDARPAKDAVDRPHRRRLQAELGELPRDRGRANLGPGVVHQALAYRQDHPLQLGRGPVGHGSRGAGAVGGPARRARVEAGDPLADPAVASTKIGSYLGRRLAGQHPRHRLPPRMLFRARHPVLPRSASPARRIGPPGLPEVERCAAGGVSEQRNDVVPCSAERCPASSHLAASGCSYVVGSRASDAHPATPIRNSMRSTAV